MGVNSGTLRAIREMLRPYIGRIKGMVRRATLGTVDTNTRLPSMQVNSMADDADDDVEMFEQYGFASVPPNGAEGLVLRVGGTRANSVGICFGNRGGRIQGLAQGEVAIYNESNGAQVIIRNDGNIEVTPGEGGVVQLGGPTATLEVARRTDPVHREQEMQDWMTAVEAGITTMAGLFNAAAGPMLSAPGTITPAQIPTVITEPFARINAGGEGSTST
jgi:phage baseplate assembly protein V